MDINEMKTVSNGIIKLCQEKGMTLSEAFLTLDLAKNYIYERMELIIGEMGKKGETGAGRYILEFKI